VAIAEYGRHQPHMHSADLAMSVVASEAMSIGVLMPTHLVSLPEHIVLASKFLPSIGATVVGATVVGATVVGATVVGATVVGATAVCATVARRLATTTMSTTNKARPNRATNIGPMTVPRTGPGSSIGSAFHLGFRKKIERDKKTNMVVRVVSIGPTDRGLKLGVGIEGFEEALRRYAMEAMSAGILGVRASRSIGAGVVVDAPVSTRTRPDGNARVVGSRVVTTRRVERGEEITVCGDAYSSDEETYARARRDMRRGIKHAQAAAATATAPRAAQADGDWYRSILSERYIHRALHALRKKPSRP